MGWFITGLVLGLITLIALFALIGLAAAYGRSGDDDHRFGRNVAGTIFGIGLVAVGLTIPWGFFYSQDAGESVVLKDVTGNVIGISTETGLHTKAPWVDTISFNIRNQSAQFAKDESNNPTGPQITVQDKDGVSHNVDVSVSYSINAGVVDAIFADWKTEDTFKSDFVNRDIRAVVRQSANKFTTLQILTEKAAFQAAIQNDLEEQWQKEGVVVESVSLQEVRSPESVTAAFAAAQEAAIAVETAKSQLAKAEVDAQQKVAVATAEAQANSILNASLSENILQQRYIDALKAGTVFVVPDNFSGILNLPTNQ